MVRMTPHITVITLGVDDLERRRLLPRRPGLASLAHNVRAEQDVDAVMQQAAGAGATIVKPAQKTLYGGYAGYFQDPDGHLWEVAFNPGLDSLG
jgi:uncharacterized glyoxalase superfamily protein PhnB